ncbi:MAG: GPW/gp25 family protein [Clostridiales bacterium]|nr:GPW/gp25 family protein [Clostridiales bacterium]
MNVLATDDIVESLNFGPTDEAEEIAQNVAVLMNTPAGNVPLERGMGLRKDYLDSPPAVAQVKFEAELADTLDDYEPRATLLSTTAKTDEDGNMGITAEVRFSG